MTGPLSVHIRPLRSDMNTYPGSFSAALERSGASAFDFSTDKRSSGKPDVIILHWPNEFFIRLGTLRTYKLLASLLAAKLRGTRIVWVVHNLAPHNKRRQERPRFRRLFFALLDGLIFLSRASRELALARYPELSNKPYLITAHGTYAEEHQPADLPPALADDRPVILGSFGQVHPYKGLDHLARLAAAFPDKITLEIAGFCRDANLKSEILGIVASNANIRADLQFLSGADLEHRLDSVDGVVLPYHEILNSGSALHALSRFRPVLAPALGSLPELQAEVGADWLTLYTAPLKPEDVLRFTEHLRQFRPAQPPDLHRHDWDSIGAAVHAFLSDLIRSRRRLK